MQTGEPTRCSFQTCFQAVQSLMLQSQNRFFSKADQETSKGGRKVLPHTKGISPSTPHLEPTCPGAHTKRTPTHLPWKVGCRQNALSQEQKKPKLGTSQPSSTRLSGHFLDQGRPSPSFTHFVGTEIRGKAKALPSRNSEPISEMGKPMMKYKARWLMRATG